MEEQLRLLLQLIAGIPLWSVYVIVGLGAAIENVFPPVPSDTFVLAGAILAEQGFLRLDLVFAVAWFANVSTALFVYAMGRRYGRAIFHTRWGQWLLRPHQLQRLADFYARYGTVSVLFSRFVPVFRVVVPAFAGISRLGAWRTALPLGLASAVWYGFLLGAGTLAARNLPRLLELFRGVRGGLWTVATVLLLLVAAWWWKGRREAAEGATDGEEGRGVGSGEEGPE